MIICGIDPSLSSTGIAFYDTKKNKLYSGCIKTDPSKWKKKFTGNGHSTKEQVVRTALSRYKYKFLNSDQADAFGIMRAAFSDYRIDKLLKQQSGGDEKGAETNIESMQRSGIAQTADENELRVYRKVKKRIFRKRPA